jgi:hypothetical protein
MWHLELGHTYISFKYCKEKKAKSYSILIKQKCDLTFEQKIGMREICEQLACEQVFMHVLLPRKYD